MPNDRHPHRSTVRQLVVEDSPSASTYSALPSLSPQKARHRFTTDEPATILVLTANAVHASAHLELQEETRDVDAALQRARCRDRYILRLHPGATFRGAIAAFDDFDPDFVHVSCHGDRAGCLMLNKTGGGVHYVPPAHFAELLALQPTRPRLVTFAACHSVQLARAAAAHADHTIGFEGPIRDSTALLFSATLYERLASRAQPDIVRAFALARLACRGLGYEDADRARLFECPGVAVG